MRSQSAHSSEQQQDGLHARADQVKLEAVRDLLCRCLQQGLDILLRSSSITDGRRALAKEHVVSELTRCLREPKRMLTYADVCCESRSASSRILTYADAC